MIGHQRVGPDPNPAESLQAAHQRQKLLGLKTRPGSRAEDKAALNGSREAVVKTLTLGFDSWETHDGGIVHNMK